MLGMLQKTQPTLMIQLLLSPSFLQGSGSTNSALFQVLTHSVMNRLMFFWLLMQKSKKSKPKKYPKGGKK